MTPIAPDAGRRLARARRVTAGVAAGVTAALSLAACGVPGGGNARTVPDEDVPYGLLLEPESPPAPTASEVRPRVNAPAVFWVEGDSLRPAASGETCAADPQVVVEGLLRALAAGPPDEARGEGLSSAVPVGFGLELSGISGETATVDLQPESSLSAEQLPVAVGQIVLTVASAPSIRTVALTTEGEPVQVPLPSGPLTDGPVTGEDYQELLPARLQRLGTVGCSGP